MLQFKAEGEFANISTRIEPELTDGLLC